MGVDSYIFDENSKECFYFDRRHNLFTSPNNERVQGLLDRIYTIKSGRINSIELIEVCNYLLKNETDLRYPGWIEAIKEFALEHPGGSFFTASDHDDYCSWDIIDDFKYKEIGDH